MHFPAPWHLRLHLHLSYSLYVSSRGTLRSLHHRGARLCHHHPRASRFTVHTVSPGSLQIEGSGPPCFSRCLPSASSSELTRFSSSLVAVVAVVAVVVVEVVPEPHTLECAPCSESQPIETPSAARSDCMTGLRVGMQAAMTPTNSSATVQFGTAMLREMRSCFGSVYLSTMTVFWIEAMDAMKPVAMRIMIRIRSRKGRRSVARNANGMSDRITSVAMFMPAMLRLMMRRLYGLRQVPFGESTVQALEMGRHWRERNSVSAMATRTGIIIRKYRKILQCMPCRNRSSVNDTLTLTQAMLNDQMIMAKKASRVLEVDC